MFRGESRKGTSTYNFGKVHIANPVLYSEKLLSPVLVQLSVGIESLVMIPNKKINKYTILEFVIKGIEKYKTEIVL